MRIIIVDDEKLAENPRRDFMKHRRLIVPLAALAALAGASAQELPQTTRAPNEGELRAFAAYYQAPPGAIAKPAFEIRRGGATHGWRVEAWSEDKPQRAAWSLCLAQRRGHAYDGKAWRPMEGEGAARRYVWLDRSSDCGVSPQRVLLAGDMADRDIVTVLEGQAAVLQGARLLFAGNTRCAPLRAMRFRLTGLAAGKNGMLVLTYLSERDAEAQVEVRKRGRELTAWNVKC